MDLKEIAFRSPNAPIEQEECLYVVKQYVKIRKGVDINPKIDTKFGRIGIERELYIMLLMSNIAINWLRINYFK